MSAEAAQLANEVAKESLLGTFGINWKLLIAQLINFSVVLFVMWKWVYTPLLKLIEDRQKKIEQGIRDAEASARSRSESERQAETAILAARKEAQRQASRRAGRQNRRRRPPEIGRRERQGRQGSQERDRRPGRRRRGKSPGGNDD